MELTDRIQMLKRPNARAQGRRPASATPLACVPCSAQLACTLAALRLELPLELVEDVPVCPLRDKLVRVGLDHTCFVQT